MLSRASYKGSKLRDEYNLKNVDFDDISKKHGKYKQYFDNALIIYILKILYLSDY
jgi:hypothetical protein